jgi:hypothetical protein
MRVNKLVEVINNTTMKFQNGKFLIRAVNLAFFLYVNAFQPLVNLRSRVCAGDTEL